jgi:hypothetical protein
MTIPESIARTLRCPCCGAVPIWNPVQNQRNGPLCDPVTDYWDREVGYSVACVSCDFVGPYGKSEKTAIDAWNDNALNLQEHFAPAAKLLEAVQFAGFKQQEAA